MDQRVIIKKLRECAKGLLEVSRELQSSERMEPPRTLEIVERQIKAKGGNAHGFCLPFVVGVDEFGDDVVLELVRLPHALVDSLIKKFGKLTGGLRPGTMPSREMPRPPATKSG